MECESRSNICEEWYKDGTSTDWNPCVQTCGYDSPVALKLSLSHSWGLFALKSDSFFECWEIVKSWNGLTGCVSWFSKFKHSMESSINHTFLPMLHCCTKQHIYFFNTRNSYFISHVPINSNLQILIHIMIR